MGASPESRGAGGGGDDEWAGVPRGGRRARDDDDWVGVPPEGRHTRDDARPGYWQDQWQAVAARAVLPLLALLALAIILLLR